MAEEAEGRRYLSAPARAGGWGLGLVLSLCLYQSVTRQEESGFTAMSRVGSSAVLKSVLELRTPRCNVGGWCRAVRYVQR